MIDENAIQALCDRIVEEFRPVKVVLFGSHAYGRPLADSDVDLLVILPFEGHPARKSLEILDRTEPRFAVDLLARTPQELQERLELGDFFLREVIEKGKVLYDAAHGRVGGEGRGRLRDGDAGVAGPESSQL